MLAEFFASRAEKDGETDPAVRGGTVNTAILARAIVLAWNSVPDDPWD